MRHDQMLKCSIIYPVTRIAFHPTKDYLAVVYGRGEICVWDTANSKMVARAKVQGNVIDTVFYMDRLTITGNNINCSWNYATGELKNYLPYLRGDILTINNCGNSYAWVVNNLAPHPDDDILGIESREYLNCDSVLLKVKDLNIEPHELMFSQLLIDGSGRRCAFSCWIKTRYGDWYPYTSVVEILDSGFVTLWWDPLDAKIYSFSPDGESIALVYSTDKDFLVIQASNDQDDIYISGVHPNVVAFHPNKPFIACGSDDCAVDLISIPDGQKFDCELLQSSVSSIAFNHSGNLIAAGDESGQVYLWAV